MIIDMTDIRTIEKTNIQNFVNQRICLDCGNDFLLTKDIIIDYTPFEQFFNSVVRLLGHSLRILFLYSEEYYKDVQNLKNGFCSHGFFADDVVLNKSFTSLETAEQLTSELKDDTRLIIAAGGYQIIETAKVLSSQSRLPLALYILTPECDTALVPYACAYQNGIRDIFITSTPVIVCVDMSAINITENFLGSGIGILASKFLALWDWDFAGIFNNEKCDYQIFQTAFSVLKNFANNAQDIFKSPKSAVFDLIQTQLKISALTQLSKTPRLLGGGEDSIFNVMEMFFLKENKKLRLRGENLILCSKIAMRAYWLWLEKLKTDIFFGAPDNILRLEKLTDYMGLGELAALKKIYMIDNIDQWEIMQYKWTEYREDLKLRLKEFLEYFKKLEQTFKRIYSDAGFWATKYLTDSDIMLMLGLAPDTTKKFTMLSFVKMTGVLDKYLVGV